MHSSKYYDRRIKREPKDFVKMSVLIDHDTKIVLDAYSEVSKKHDIKMLEEQLDELNLSGFKYFIADKGYDSMSLYFFFREKEVKFIVPRRENRAKKLGLYTRRRGGILLAVREKQFNLLIYRKRSVVEAVFSYIKRRFGSYIQAANKRNRVKGAYLKIVVYNLGVVKKLLSEGSIRGIGASYSFLVIVEVGISTEP